MANSFNAQGGAPKRFFIPTPDVVLVHCSDTVIGSVLETQVSKQFPNAKGWAELGRYVYAQFPNAAACNAALSDGVLTVDGFPILSAGPGSGPNMVKYTLRLAPFGKWLTSLWRDIGVEHTEIQHTELRLKCVSLDAANKIREKGSVALFGFFVWVFNSQKRKNRKSISRRKKKNAVDLDAVFAASREKKEKANSVEAPPKAAATLEVASPVEHKMTSEKKRKLTDVTKESATTPENNVADKTQDTLDDTKPAKKKKTKRKAAEGEE